ncbi:MAG: DNA repair protein RecN [candidate division Zixibacteria bacterium]|nr:DNA repair protein RecN [candidate division Zixibacteria bacterium]
MLKHLHIENIALLDTADLDFDKGMLVLTGETGAGKSIIVTALALALGSRAEREYIRHGEDRATVTATFGVSQMPAAYRKQFADCIVDGTITVTREIARDGNSRVRVNDTASSLGRLRDIVSPLAEILGQHANQMLMDEANHLGFLDRFGSLEQLREEVALLYESWDKASAEYKRTVARRDQLVEERELLLYQKAEIEKANLRSNEEDALLRERKILDSSRALASCAAQIEQILGGDENAVVQQIRFARKELEKMAAVDSSLEPQLAELIDLDYRVEELRRFVEQYGGSIPDDPARLEEINERLDEIYKLKKKFGGTVDAVLEHLDAINLKLANRPDIDTHIAHLEKEQARLFERYSGKARDLSGLRRKAADYLHTLVVKELAELAIEGANFECEFISEMDPQGVEIGTKKLRPFPHGLETGHFLFSANKGEPLKSLVKTASGGEISRVLLALKAAEKKNNNLARSLLVFDEVDVGIGGQTAFEVAKKLKRLSEETQVMVVTHLHQIARLADHHFVATKTSKRGRRAVIEVRKLGATQIKSELDRMVALP